MSEITLNMNNWNLIMQIVKDYLEKAHEKGSFILAESAVLQRCLDVLNGGKDVEISYENAVGNIIQAFYRGNTKGAWKLSDALTIERITKFLANSKDLTTSKSVNNTSTPSLTNVNNTSSRSNTNNTPSLSNVNNTVNDHNVKPTEQPLNLQIVEPPKQEEDIVPAENFKCVLTSEEEQLADKLTEPLPITTTKKARVI